ncbi:MAG: coenzyme F420-0:L-glutamate ligase, partial [Methanomicrobiales archaeon]
ASTIYSKARGFTRRLSDITPSERAERIARRDKEDPRFVQSVLDEAREVLLEHPFILSEMAFGHIGVRSGVDRSNIEDGMVILLPPDPMGGAREIREKIRAATGKEVGVIITDTCGRAFRRGQTGNAIGWAGFPAIRDYRNDTDLFGHVLLITEEAVVDEIAGFANFVMGESHQGIPAAVFRGCGRWTGHDDLYFKPAEDVIRKAICTYVGGPPGGGPVPGKR